MNQRRAGLLLINTGDGKGKTTAAIGTAFRALGHGMRVAVIQFIKGKWRTGERKLGEHTENLIWLTMGNGCTLHSADRTKDHDAARSAWTRAQELLQSEELDLLILDEILYAINLKFVSAGEVVAALNVRREHLHVILTGRQAPAALIEIADLVTEMRTIKHPFEKGGKGQIGLDF
jgi:cob(I)alamin adenosyltransferase